MAPLLQGIRVLDFGRYLAGPYCAAMFAEYGADVIRIEKRDGSEDRFTAPLAESAGSMFPQMNCSKRSIPQDPASAGGREVVARMVKGADVVIANLPAATLMQMGLDDNTLKSYRDHIIFVTNTVDGPVGPMSWNVGFDTIGQAMSGAMYMTGGPGRQRHQRIPLDAPVHRGLKGAWVAPSSQGNWSSTRLARRRLPPDAR